MNNEIMNQWIDDLLKGKQLNCVCCGHRHPPGASRADLLNHVRVCPEHPLGRALDLIQDAYIEGFSDGESQAMRDAQGRSSLYLWDCWDCSVSKRERSEI